VAIKGDRPVFIRVDKRQERDAGNVIGRGAVAQPGHDIDADARRFALDPTANRKGCGVAPGSAFERDLGPADLDKAGGVGESGGGIIGQCNEGTAKSHAARSGIREAELQGGWHRNVLGRGGTSSKTQRQGCEQGLSDIWSLRTSRMSFESAKMLIKNFHDSGGVAQLANEGDENSDRGEVGNYRHYRGFQNAKILRVANSDGIQHKVANVVRGYIGPHQ